VSVRHLYVHVPFCAHRCGYCDFVTVTGREHHHAAYVDALLHELDQHRALLSDPLDTVFLGGGTPTLLAPPLLQRLLAGLPAADEVTVEANPETVNGQLAEALLAGGANRVSLGAQSFGAAELAVLERRARPEQVRGAFATLREAGFDNLNLDLIFGVPGQTEEALDRDLSAALELGPEHVSYYELEAKPGTRFTVHHGAELARQAERLEGYYERVVETLEAAGYRWYETANFCRPGREARHNLAYWTGRDYLGIGVGAVSTLGLERRANRPRLEPYLSAIQAGEPAPAAIEQLTPAERTAERVMLGLRLAAGVSLDALHDGVDPQELERLTRLGLVERADGGGTVKLTRRGRMVANDVTASLVLL
jgi:oxygen-independent coproporphyrinogen III oxidase